VRFSSSAAVPRLLAIREFANLADLDLVNGQELVVADFTSPNSLVFRLKLDDEIDKS